MTRLLVTFLVSVCVLMCGPRLQVDGSELFGMPWKLALHVPLLRDALPLRFAVYAFLALALIAALWLNAPRPLGVKLAAIGLLAIFLCPNLLANFWSSHDDTPEFFSAGACRRVLKPGENIIVLPYGIVGASMLWQAVAEFYFRMAGGWSSITPREFERWPVVGAMLTRTYLPESTQQLLAFMTAHDVSAIVVADPELQFWQPMLAPLGRQPIRIGGVAIYRVASSIAVQQSTSALEMERRSNLGRFSVLLLAARRYLAQNEDLAKLSPMLVQQLGWLPPHWVTDPDVRTNNGLYLGPWGDNQVAVGVVGTYAGLQPLISRYRSAAAQIFFPFPTRLVEPPRGDTFMRLLVMGFTREGLDQAAQERTPTLAVPRPRCLRQRDPSVSSGQALSRAGEGLISRGG
jgi:hypothetical protein